MIRHILAALIFFHTLPSAGRELSLKEMRQNLQKIEKSIQETQKEMKKIDDVRFLPDLYFTLAEFYLEQARYVYSIENAENKGRKNAEPDFTKATDAKKKAVELYERFLELFPSHPDQDKALFFKAHEHRELGQTEQMVLTYKQLTERFPKSPFWMESHIVLGDHFFEAMKELEQALFHFQEVIKAPLGPFTPLAHYKAGWVYINQQKFADAFTEYEQSLKKGQQVDLLDLPELYKKTDVRENALLAMVWPYSELKEQELVKFGLKGVPAVSYFKSLSYSYRAYQKVLSKLGQRMELKKRHAEAFQAYAELLRTSEDLSARIDAILRLYEIFKNHLKRSPEPILPREIAKTAIRLKQSQEIGEAEKAVTYKNFEIFARDIATQLHEKAKRSGQAEDYKNAVESYRYYLWAYENHPNAPKIRLNLAESYFNHGRKVEAGMLYERLSRAAENAKSKRQFLESAFEAYTSVVKTPAQWSRLEMVQSRSGIRGVGALLLRRYPDTPAKATILFSVAQTYYDERKFTQAVKEFKKFITAFPRDSRVSAAANQIMDIHNQSENYEQMIADGDFVLNNQRIVNADLKSNIRQIVQQARLRKIQKVTGSSSSKKYAEKLVEFARSYSGDIGEQALFEAFVTLKSQSDLKAYEPAEILMRKYPESRHYKDVLLALGQMALATADFGRAAGYFEKFAERFAAEPEARDLLSQAAQLREFLGQYDLAKKNFSVIRNATGMARMDFLREDWQALAASSGRVSNMMGAYWQGIAAYRLGQTGQALTHLTSAAQASGGPYEEREASAHAAFLLTQIEFENYGRLKMRAGQEAQDVAGKTKGLEQIVKLANATLGKGSGVWTIATLYALGLAHAEYNDFLVNAPAPAGLSGEQLQLYRQALQQKGQGFADKARFYFEECLTKAEEFDVFTAYVEGCRSLGRKPVADASVFSRARGASVASSRKHDAVRSKLLKNPRDLEVFLELSDLFFRENNYPDAMAVLQRAFELHPDNPRVLAQIGNAHLYQQDDLRAGARFAQALKQNPTEPAALRGLAGLQNKYGFQSKLAQTRNRLQGADSTKDHLHPLGRSF